VRVITFLFGTQV